ncbi:MAG: phosphopantothenoylcysteine decarboxylase, partial [Selenomonadaceae bacterium]
KNLDMIVANDVSKPGAGFNTDTNLVKIITRDSDVKELPMMDKKRIAEVIVDMAKEKLQEKCRG